MSKTLKISILNHPENGIVTFVTKSQMNSIDDIKNEIFQRMSELKDQPLTFYYKGDDNDKISILNGSDFKLFQDRNIRKLFVSLKNVPNDENETEAKVDNFNFIDDWDASSSMQICLAPRSAKLTCNGCSSSIQMSYYRCLHCTEYLLCFMCRPKMYISHFNSCYKPTQNTTNHVKSKEKPNEKINVLKVLNSYPGIGIFSNPIEKLGGRRSFWL
ncbi:uncharacterized protein LOC116341378 [Contarinia nasturtii]|uniref:uncharacterized protein LOC116341378 n=1 Tax=Contarinia nasturtii TaxID=265458 RepID=UPI0012D4959A|nr:uncharacterized protein LOC116341378 [Contarinia nasturtii]